MSIWLTVFLILYFLYAVFITRWISRVYDEKLQAFKEIPEEAMKKYSAFQRKKEVENIKKWKLIVGCLFILPVRMTMYTLTLILWQVTFIFLTRGYDIEKPLPKSRRWWIRKTSAWIARWAMFWGYGAWTIEIVNKRFEEYDPEYKEMDDTINHDKSPLIVINHIGIQDGFLTFILDYGPCCISKSAVKKIPIIGSIVTNSQTLYFNRKDPEERKNILSKIQERIRLAETTTMAPLVIFPEGTVSNGDYLLTFKKGAFFGLRPCRVLCYRYETNEYKPYNGHEGDLEGQILNLCSFGCHIKIYVFERLFDPTYLNLNKDDENAPMIYAEKVRTIMSKCMNVPMVDQGFRTTTEFTGIYKEVLQNIRNRRKGKKVKAK